MKPEITPQAYAQWVEVEIFAENMDITIKSIGIEFGKFHTPGNKDEEIGKGTIDGTIIKSGHSYKIAACGRESAATGTEGSFELYHGETKLGKYHWLCPWNTKTNESTFTEEKKEQYKLSFSPGNIDSGAIGHVKIMYIMLS